MVKNHLQSWARDRRRPTPLFLFGAKAAYTTSPTGCAHHRPLELSAAIRYTFTVSRSHRGRQLCHRQTLGRGSSHRAGLAGTHRRMLRRGVYRRGRWSARDHRGAVAGAVRLHLLHRRRGIRTSYHAGSRPAPHPRHPRTGRQESLYCRRRCPSAHGCPTHRLGQIHQLRTDLRSARLPAGAQPGRVAPHRVDASRNRATIWRGPATQPRLSPHRQRTAFRATGRPPLPRHPALRRHLRPVRPLHSPHAAHRHRSAVAAAHRRDFRPHTPCHAVRRHRRLCRVCQPTRKTAGPLLLHPQPANGPAT